MPRCRAACMPLHYLYSRRNGAATYSLCCYTAPNSEPGHNTTRRHTDVLWYKHGKLKYNLHSAVVQGPAPCRQTTDHGN